MYVKGNEGRILDIFSIEDCHRRVGRRILPCCAGGEESIKMDCGT
jgi:hypothetical protein